MHSRLVLVAAAVCVALGDENNGKPEAAWLTTDLLEKWVEDFGFSVVKKNEDRLLVKTRGHLANSMFVEFADNDSLKLTTSWDSTQTGLGDGPIVNGWNNERRFCKVSISDKDDGSKTTLMVMHLDQLLPTVAGAEAVRTIAKKTLDLFETGVNEFDQFSRDTYRAWQKQQQQQQQQQTA